MGFHLLKYSFSACTGPNLHPASVTSTSVMDLWKPSRDTANINKVFATTNFVDLIDDVEVVVLETKAIDAHMNINLPQLLDDLGKAGYVSRWSNEEHMIFEKSVLNSRSPKNKIL